MHSPLVEGLTPRLTPLLLGEKGLGDEGTKTKLN